MKIFTGDWHLHPFRSYSTVTESGLNSRLAEQVEVVMGIIGWGADHGASHLIHPGDVFHTQGETVSKDVVRAAYVLFEKSKNAGMENIIVPGNHDVYRGKTLFRSFQDVATIITRPTTTYIGNELYTFIPYIRSEKKFYKVVLEEARKVDWNKEETRFLVCHQMFVGARVGASECGFRMKRAVRTDSVRYYNYVVAGHCHKPQIIGHNIYYPGSPLQHDHGDVGQDHGFLFWDGQQLQLMPVAGPKFHQVIINDLNDYKMFIEDYIESDYYRIAVDSEVDVELPQSRKIEVVRTVKQKSDVRIKTESKPHEDIIAEAVERHPTVLDKESILSKALEFWGEAGEQL